jgi:hypothetical protein
MHRSNTLLGTQTFTMASDTAPEVYDLLILVDATYSMFNYLEALRASLPKVIAISKLTNSFARIGLLAYRDYSESANDRLEWSGWYNYENPDAPDAVLAATLMTFAVSLEPNGGGDFPEATKTGLARAYSLMRKDTTTIIFLYTDAPPQCWMVADTNTGSNYMEEQAALKPTTSFGGYGPYFADWVSACNQLHTGPKKAHVFCFLDGAIGSVLNYGYYTYLSTITRGACLSMTSSTPHDIAQISVDVLLSWMGAQKDGVENDTMPAKLVRYKTGHKIKQIEDEKDVTANMFFWAHAPAGINKNSTRATEKIKDEMTTNLATIDLDTEVLAKYLPKKQRPVDDFAQRYSKDEQYKTVVIEELRAIIEADVTSMSLNPVFGSLWRAVCNDRTHPEHGSLTQAFGLHVDKIADANERTRMKTWLEGSYDFASEILEALEQVPGDLQFPCVFLDPTIAFEPAREKSEKDDDGNDGDHPVTALRRDELLELGRSCDGRILRRLGKILTQLTYVESPADLPAHIATTNNATVPRIPLSLASKEQGWRFWKIILHAVLPGTMLSARPATVLAALAIRIGLKPLFEPACAAMMFWRDKWNNIEVPENWNASCLALLLDADEEYQKQITNMNTTIVNGDGLLLEADRALFHRLVTYQLTGKNLLTTLTAEIGWTPNKTEVAIGPLVICRGCKFPRSVTIMVERSGGKCGLCVAEDWTDNDHKKRATAAHVSAEDTEATRIAWVECNVRTCRAQYVCYNPGDLKVRSKCHYCRKESKVAEEKRNDDPAPTLECVMCLSKVIWPKEYRPSAMESFNCVACQNKHKTVVGVETTAKEVCKENGSAWLLRNNKEVLKEPFERSLFHTISTVGTETFLVNVQALPDFGDQLKLTLRGKRLRNATDVVAQLAFWVQRRTFERSPCSLCFTDFPKSRLRAACCRRGCSQQICDDCLRSWYGSNRAGTILNIAALFCPFCRRPPRAKTLAAYGKGVHAVGGLIMAIEERGQWIHAWCRECGNAKQYMERVCARGTPAAISDWGCEPCVSSNLIREQAQREEEAQRALREATDERQRRTALHQVKEAERLRRELGGVTKPCPGCKIPTQKSFGCNHMQCAMPKCKVHWCWECGLKFPKFDIYRHMNNEHGGWYPDDDEESDERETL